MIYGSVCSGIEAATVAWESFGWHPAWFAEIAEFPNAVLACRYPSVPNLGDITKIYEKKEFKQKIDLLVGGTPCQSFSAAGKRGGLDDPSGNLAIEFLRIARIIKPCWIVWENVPRVLSINKGDDFRHIVSEVQKLGYGFSYRILDARHFGVSQRRKRVFLVGYLGDWRPSVAVLFEPEVLCGDVATSHYKKKGTKQKTKKCVDRPDKPIGVDLYNYNVTGDIATTLNANCHNKNSHGPKVLDLKGLRIHTPIECERLQGFPDGYTDIVFKGKTGLEIAKHRCKALGNSMAVPVMRWIGRRIDMFNKISSSIVS
jgi:DNA (cytosine-5)-methyltransferase 1